MLQRERDGLATVGRDFSLAAPAPEKFPHGLPVLLVVIDDEDVPHLAAGVRPAKASDKRIPHAERSVFSEDRGRVVHRRVAKPLNSRVASLDPRSRRLLEEAGFEWDASTGVWLNNHLGRGISLKTVRDHDPEWLKNWLATGTS
jgi:hypothetical protein